MYFYLEWLEKRPSKIIITKEKPKNINFISEFKMNKEKFIICGNISNDFKNYEYSKELRYRKNQYLSSHLQKCIRRMDILRSIQTAKHFIDLDIQSFLRRLPIIMLEDVCIHNSFPILIWLMISISKGFQMKNEIIQWLLGIIYYLSQENKKQSYLNHRIEELHFNEMNNIIYQTLHFRKKYGGMKGDMNMIEYYKHLIYQNNIEIKNDKIHFIKLKIENLEYRDWLHQANDFHCNRYIIQKIKNYYPEYSEEILKRLVWEYSSSYNKRIKKEKLKNDDWNKIKKRVKYIQKNCQFY